MGRGEAEAGGEVGKKRARGEWMEEGRRAEGARGWRGEAGGGKGWTLGREGGKAWGREAVAARA